MGEYISKIWFSSVFWTQCRPNIRVFSIFSIFYAPICIKRGVIVVILLILCLLSTIIRLNITQILLKILINAETLAKLADFGQKYKLFKIFSIFIKTRPLNITKPEIFLLGCIFSRVLFDDLSRGGTYFSLRELKIWIFLGIGSQIWTKNGPILPQNPLKTPPGIHILVEKSYMPPPSDRFWFS